MASGLVNFASGLTIDVSGWVAGGGGGGGGSSRSVAGDTDNAIITWVTSDDTFAAESTFIYDGSTVSLSGDMVADGNITLGSSGTLYSSGVASSGLRLGIHTPIQTNETLYNDAGTLKFNGSAVGLDHAINSGQKAYDLAVAVTNASGNANLAAITDLTTELRTESASGVNHAADIIRNSASGTNHAADIIRNSASGTAMLTELRTESASGVNHAADIIRLATSGTNHAADIILNSASGTQAFAEFRSGFAVSGITYANGVDNRIATFTDTNALNGEANLTFDGSTLSLINTHTRLSVANDGSITASGHITTSGNIITSGVSTSGVHLQPIAPTLSGYPTTNVLYNDNGTLKFDGSAVGGGGGGGSMTTVKSNGSAVGGTDIVTLDFSSDFGVAETPDTEINITIGTLNQNTTGSAATLTTARAINGEDFDGSAAITVTAAGSTLSDTVTVAKGGTNATSFADKAVIITQDSSTDTLSAAVMDANGELLIGGTSGPAVATLTQGDNMTITNADGAITLAAAGAGISDQILKDNVITLSTNGLDAIDQLNPVEFDWNQLAFDSHNGKTGHDFGLIAQEVEQIFPEAVSLWRDHKAVDYAKLTVILIKAVQELRQEVEDLKNA